MNNFGGFNPGNFPPPPKNPNQAYWEEMRRRIAGWLANQKKQEEEQGRNQPPVVIVNQKPLEVFARSETPPVKEGHPVIAVLMFFVMCFITFVAGGIAFGATRKLVFVVPLLIVGVIISAAVSVKIWNWDQ